MRTKSLMSILLSSFSSAMGFHLGCSGYEPNAWAAYAMSLMSTLPLMLMLPGIFALHSRLDNVVAFKKGSIDKLSS